MGRSGCARAGVVRFPGNQGIAKDAPLEAGKEAMLKIAAAQLAWQATQSPPMPPSRAWHPARPPARQRPDAGGRDDQSAVQRPRSRAGNSRPPLPRRTGMAEKREEGSIASDAWAGLYQCPAKAYSRSEVGWSSRMLVFVIPLILLQDSSTISAATCTAGAASFGPSSSAACPCSRPSYTAVVSFAPG